MTVEQVLAALVPTASGLGDRLRALLASEPALAGLLQPWIDSLSQEVTPAALASVLAVAEPELAAFLKTWKLVPREHPSDLVG